MSTYSEDKYGIASTWDTYNNVPISIEFVPLEICCPCRNHRCDPDLIIKWTCSKAHCKEILMYDFRGHVYCSCGQANVESFEFKCPNPSHANFSLPDIKCLEGSLLKIKPLKPMNILILGETGVGKSTWINGFVNFLSYNSLEEAEMGELKSLIPTRFTVLVGDDDDEEVVVSTGASLNEVHSPGQSATQTAKIYPFKVGQHLVRIIDTPGICDTRGPTQDELNLENILATISTLNELHGICILLQPNKSRLTIEFKFCIQELLTYLHRDACKNIIFCFTNSRGSLYTPGDTLPPLRTLLNKIENVTIPCTKQNRFCFDSEAYRFLAAVKNDPPISFSDSARKSFHESWIISIEETNRMIEYIAKLPPHVINNTINLNDTRQLVLKLTRPLAEINKTNQSNFQIMEEEMLDLKKMKGTVQDLEKRRMVKRTVIEPVPIPHPKTVCSNKDCTTVWDIGRGQFSTEYATVCHNPCQLKGVQADVLGAPQLVGCTAMGGSSYCQKCKHHYMEHLHVYYDSKQKQVEVVNEAIEEALRNCMSNHERKHIAIYEQKKLIEEYRLEIFEIERACAYFASFLKENAISPYNDAMEEYLEHFIKEEQMKEAITKKPSRFLEQLRKSKERYAEQKRILEVELTAEHGSSANQHLTQEDIRKQVNGLLNLKHSGNTLRKALECITNAQKAIVTYGSHTVKPMTFKQSREGKGLDKKAGIGSFLVSTFEKLCL